MLLFKQTLVRLQEGKTNQQENGVKHFLFLMFSRRGAGCLRKLILLTKSLLALNMRPHAYTGLLQVPNVVAQALNPCTKELEGGELWLAWFTQSVCSRATQ